MTHTDNPHPTKRSCSSRKWRYLSTSTLTVFFWACGEPATDRESKSESPIKYANIAVNINTHRSSPWIGLVSDQNNQACTGTLINDQRHIITASHCLPETYGDPTGTVTFMNSHERVRFQVVRVDVQGSVPEADELEHISFPITHMRRIGTGDLAIARLARPVPESLTYHTNIATSLPAWNDQVTTVGFGASQATATPTGWTNIYGAGVKREGKWNWTGSFSTTNLITMPGDSGGPTVWNGLIVALTASGNGSNANLENVVSYRSNIANIINSWNATYGTSARPAYRLAVPYVSFTTNTWTTLRMINPSASQVANLSIQYINSDGSVQKSFWGPLAALDSRTFDSNPGSGFSSSGASLSNWSGAMIILSDRPVTATNRLKWGQAYDEHTVVSEGDSEVTLPYVMHANNGWDSEIVIQNLNLLNSLPLAITFRRNTATSGTEYWTLPAGGRIVLPQSLDCDLPGTNGSCSAAWLGIAKIAVQSTGPDNLIAASIIQRKSVNNIPNRLMATAGIPRGSALNFYYLPLFMSNFGGTWFTHEAILNLAGAASVNTVLHYDSNTATGSKICATASNTTDSISSGNVKFRSQLADYIDCTYYGKGYVDSSNPNCPHCDTAVAVQHYQAALDLPHAATYTLASDFKSRVVFPDVLHEQGTYGRTTRLRITNEGNDPETLLRVKFTANKTTLGNACSATQIANLNMSLLGGATMLWPGETRLIRTVDLSQLSGCNYEGSVIAYGIPGHSFSGISDVVVGNLAHSTDEMSRYSAIPL